MNHYNVVLSTELLDVPAYSQVLETLRIKCEQLQMNKRLVLGDFGSHFATVIRPVQELQENRSLKQDDDFWTEIRQEQPTENVVHYCVPVIESQ
ncbi:hypothetical protein LSH36_442g00048 [Paralvinella palmiformis]|uniref:Uncharacterized protein n=1 Tax=Paralvinella palmiformis TaxID=53620 RepID=A0AAD9N0F0_9ANNE|nr:hypothetical protein LSH36_442g00048 [Paralvinella palmiformis]